MSRDAIHYMRPEELCILPQVRKQENEAADAGLMQSLREVGVLHPILARREDGKVFIVDGHRRKAAAVAIRMERIPVIIEDALLDESAVIQRQLIANCQRENLTALEKAVSIRELMEKSHCSAAQAAGKLGMSPAAVSKLLPLLDLPEAIRQRVASGEINASAGYELSRVNDPARQAELALQLAAGQLTRDAVTGAAEETRKRRTTQAEKQTARVTAILGESRSVTVASAGLTLERFIELIEELLSKARRVRTQGVELATFIKMLKDQARAG